MNSIIEAAVKELESRETEMRGLLNALSRSFYSEKRELSSVISAKMADMKSYLEEFECELLEIENKRDSEESSLKYREVFTSHLDTFTQMEEELRSIMSTVPAQESNNKKAPEGKEIVSRGLELQNEQKISLQNAIQGAQQIETTGEEIHVELKRQGDQLTKAMEGMESIDSELVRAKKIMKVIITRAAGDNCVRVLAILVLLAILTVIALEIFMPGRMKRNTEAWYNSQYYTR